MVALLSQRYELSLSAGYYRIGDHSAVSGYLRYFNLGEVYTSTDENATTINPYEMSLDVAYSLMLSEKFSPGSGSEMDLFRYALQ